jgi:hypothetical protein
MFNIEFSREEMAMTDARPQLVSAPSISRSLATVAAGLLICLGVVIQLGEYICGRLNATSYWLVHMIATNLWNALLLRLNAPGVGDALRFWPLLLVIFGLAILVALRPEKPAAATVSSGERDRSE